MASISKRTHDVFFKVCGGLIRHDHAKEVNEVILQIEALNEENTQLRLEVERLQRLLAIETTEKQSLEARIALLEMESKHHG